MTRVVILYKNLPAYRLEFFDQLRSILAEQNIDLDLIHGNAVGADASKGDARTLPWAIYVENRAIKLGRRFLIWQPTLRHVRGADLVIVEQASKLLVNYVLLLGSMTRLGPRLAFWGHGANLQRHTASRVSEFLKRRYSRLPHWWFAYTDGSRDRVAEMGFAPERITVVQNAVDTATLRRDVDAVTRCELMDFFNEHSIASGHTALFLGSLYPEKRLQFLVQAANRARQLDEKFTLLVGGDGPARSSLMKAIEKHDHIRYLGRLDGAERARAVAASDVMLMPGLVGLGILDAFAGGTPIVTTRVDYHSPEIEYLEDGRNGILLDEHVTPHAYGQTVVDLLRDNDRLSTMSEQCHRDALVYTTHEMVRRFAGGITAALEQV